MSRHSPVVPSFRLLLAGLLLLMLTLPANAAPAADGAQGSISGTVIDLVTGAPVKNMQVVACLWNGDKCGPTIPFSHYTDEQGHYAINALAEGEYQVCFYPANYVYECYDDRPEGAATTRIMVGPDQVVTGIDAALMPRACIRGRVTDAASGQPVGPATVTAYIWRFGRWEEQGNAVTDGKGQYEIGNLKPGTYRVTAHDRLGQHPDRSYVDPNAPGGSTDLAVGHGGIVEGVDIALPAFGHMQGQVTKRGTGAPIPGITVEVQSTTTWNRTWSVTASDGRFDVGGLTDDAYWGRFEDPQHRYTSCYYSGAEGSCERVEVRGVLAGVKEGVDQSLAETGGIAGLVEDEDGRAAIGVVLHIFPPVHDEYLTGTTDEQGRVEVRTLDAGAYTCRIDDAAGRYETLDEVACAGFTIAPGQMALRRWVVQRIKTGPRVVRGRVTDAATGEPLPGIKLALQKQGCEVRHGCWYDDVATTSSGADGAYEFTDPPTADRLLASDPEGLYDQVIFPGFHFPEPGETLIADFALGKISSLYGRLVGTLNGTDGQPLCNFSVTAQTATGEQHAAGYVQSKDGRYSLLVPPNVYKLRFSAYEPYLNEWYDDARSEADAQAVTVQADEVITANATLSMWGRIAGRVTDEAGKPLSYNTTVSFYNAAGPTPYPRYTYADAEGRYTSPYLPDGNYRVRFESFGRDDLWWGGGHDISTGADVAVRTDHVTEGIDAALIPGGAISGRVTDRQTGEPVARIQVEARSVTVYTGPDGSFAFSGLPTGSYKLIFRDVERRYIQEKAENVAVTAPATPALDVPLTPGGRGVGQVTDNTGAPLARIEVAFAQDEWIERTVTTDDDGRFDSGPLTGGDNLGREPYVISFKDRSGMHRNEYYRDAADEAGAHRVMIPPGETVTLDAALDTMGRVSGTVTDAATGRPLPDVKASVIAGGKEVQFAWTMGNGTYLLDRLLPGPAALTFTDCCRRYATVSRPITVELNTVLEGQDAELGPWGKLSGRVTDAVAGEPLGGIWVIAHRPNKPAWQRAAATVTNADGTYAFAGLDSGSYRIEFVDPRLRHYPAVYPTAQSLRDGVDVAFTMDRDAVHIDTVLKPVGDTPTRDEQRMYLPLVVE